MSNENRTPVPDVMRNSESQSYMNVAIQTAVQEAVKSVFASLAPVLKDMALTPEKLREANRPYQDPAHIARELRESLKSKEDEAELRRMTQWRKDHCTHKDKNGNDSISIVHNQLDHQPRGVCMLCHDWIHPREWYVDAPDPITGKTNAHIRPAHKDYPRIQIIESMQ